MRGESSPLTIFVLDPTADPRWAPVSLKAAARCAAGRQDAPISTPKNMRMAGKDPPSA
jgi:hypothetical protein